MSIGQRKLAFIFSLIIGGLLLIYSYSGAFIDFPISFSWFDIFSYPGLFLTSLVKQPTLYLGIVVIGIGTFILKGGKA